MTRFALLLLAALIALPAPALADKYDAWINVFRIPGLAVESVTDNGSPRGKTAQQQIKGRIGNAEVVFSISRPGCLRGWEMVPIACHGLARFTSSIYKLESRFGVSGGRNRQFRNTADRSVISVWFEYEEGRCTGAVAMYRYGASGDYGTTVYVTVCGDQQDRVVDYLTQMRPSDPVRNKRDEAAMRRALADGHYLEDGPPPLDPNERWINLYSMNGVVDASFDLAKRPDGRTDGYVQIASGTIGDEPIHLTTRDVPCRNKHGVRGRCSKADIRKAAAAPDFFSARFGIDGAPTVKRVSTPKHYGIRFSFTRDGRPCQGMYLGIARLEKRAAFGMTVEGTACGPAANNLINYLKYIGSAIERVDG